MKLILVALVLLILLIVHQEWLVPAGKPEKTAAFYGPFVVHDALTGATYEITYDPATPIERRDLSQIERPDVFPLYPQSRH